MRKLRGFSLVELLVVIGILVVLISILLPTLGRARESSNRTSCLSNLRQLGMAMMMYVQDNNGWFPNSANSVQQKHDWVYWQPGRDRAEGRLVAYTGDSFSEKLYICPSDDVSLHPGPNPYPFSYTLNARIGGAYETATTYKPLFTPTRLQAIMRPAEKILLIDEAWTGIDDGAFAPTTLNPDDGHSHNMLSNRHDKKGESITDARAGKGNAVFADGHGDFVERRMGLMPQHVEPKRR